VDAAQMPIDARCVTHCRSLFGFQAFFLLLDRTTLRLKLMLSP